MRGEEGQSLVLVALSMIALVGVVGLALDAGQVMLARRELTRLTDAAALAAAGALTTLPDERDMEHPRAEARANEYVRLHGFDPDAAGNSLSVTFPSGSPARKLVQVQTSRAVPLTFMKIFGISSATVSSAATQGEAPPLDIVLVQDVSISQLIGTHRMPNANCLVNPAYGGIRDPDVATGWYSCSVGTVTDLAYHPELATHMLDGSWPPKASPRTNVPWEPFADQQDAARYFVSQLDPTYDKIGIVAFSDSGTEKQALTNDLNEALDAIGLSPRTNGMVGKAGLKPGGSTNLAAGIQRGLATLTSASSRTDAIATMILLTDGSATKTLGGSIPSGCYSGDLAKCSQCRQDAMTQATNAANMGVVIYTIFVGSTDWERDNALVMQWIADKTDNRKLEGDYTGSRALPSGWAPAYDADWFRANVSDNYYRAYTADELQTAYNSILRKIYTRLVR